MISSSSVSLNIFFLPFRIFPTTLFFPKQFPVIYYADEATVKMYVVAIATEKKIHFAAVPSAINILLRIFSKRNDIPSKYHEKL